MQNSKSKFLILLLALCGCQKCKETADPCEGKALKFISEGIAKSVPYTDNQVVTFKESDGDEFDVTVDRVDEVDVSDYNCADYFEVGLLESGAPFPMINFLSRGGDTTIKVIQLYISALRNNTGRNFKFVVATDGTLTYLPPINNTTHSALFHNELMIDGTIYNEVLEVILPDSTGAQGVEHVKNLKINKQNGILEFTAGNNIVTTLKN